MNLFDSNQYRSDSVVEHWPNKAREYNVKKGMKRSFLLCLSEIVVNNG